MTDRGRLVYALLRTLLAWAPGPRAHNATTSGFVSSHRGCLHCQAVGRWSKEHRRKVDAGCPHCGGTGVRPLKDAMDDPIKNPPRDHRRINVFRDFDGTTTESDRDRAHRLDTEIAKLEANRVSREGCGDCVGCRAGIECVEGSTGDDLTRAVEVRDRMYRHGSYAHLEAALAKLRETRPVAYTAAMWVAYQPLGEAPIDCARSTIVEICETLALLMDGPIRVPEDVPISADEQTERLAREGKGALWRGRGDWHKMRRHERDALIAAMSAEGRPPGEIALRFNLTRKRVQQIVAEQAAKADGSATGPAA